MRMEISFSRRQVIGILEHFAKKIEEQLHLWLAMKADRLPKYRVLVRETGVNLIDMGLI